MPYALREALAACRRAPLLVTLSVIAVSLSLFVLGLFALTAYNIQTALDQIEERVELVAYLRDGVSQEQIRLAESEIRSLPEVLDVRYVSRTEALAVAVQELPEFRELFTGIDVNPLPASFEVRLRPGYRNPESVERLAQILLAFPFVEDAHFGRDWVARIVSLRRIAAGATMMIGGAFAGVAGIIIATAVRIAVFARREEIEIMRLVGATDGFIRRPFQVEGLFAGLLGGMTAALMTYGAFRFVGVALIELAWIPSLWVAGAVAAGAVYGLLASSVAVRRHLRAV
jgi:cell division transport system permease protein